MIGNVQDGRTEMKPISRFSLGVAGLMSTIATTALLQIVLAVSGSSPANAASDTRAAPPPASAAASQPLGPSDQLPTYRPDGQLKGVAIFLSGDGGWNLGVVDMAKALTRQGVAVVGVSTPAFLKAMEASRDRCVDPNRSLTALAQDFERRLGLSRYQKPILVGYSSGATIAYAVLAQAPAGTWRGAVSLGFGPDLPGNKPWCAGASLSAKAITKPERGWLFAPVRRLSAPWLVLQGAIDQVVSPAVTRAFVKQVVGASYIELPKVGHGFSVEARWMPQFVSAFAPLLGQEAANAAGPRSSGLRAEPVA